MNERELRTSERITRIRALAYWLDAGLPVPGTPWRVGLDPFIGLVPGFGDAAGAVLAGWILFEAAQAGASAATLFRMAVNVAIDEGVGAIPFLGDLFDFAWKANLRNVALLERHLAEPVRARRAERGFTALIIGAVVVVGLIITAAGVFAAVALAHFISAHVAVHARG